MKDILIFTDGSTLNNQKKGSRSGGVGVFFGDNDKRNISLSLKEDKKTKVTNQVAELSACYLGLKKLISTEKINNRKIKIYTDSMYIVNIINVWGENWEKNKWKKKDGKIIENLKLIKKLYYYSKNLNVEYNHVKSHQKEPKKSSSDYYIWWGNNQADKLAVDASNRI